jgi:hypothetical protein
MQAEEVQDPHSARAKASLKQEELEGQQCWLALADLLAAYYMTVATALTTLTGAVVVVALITFVVGKVVHLVEAAALDSLVPVQQIPEDLTQTPFTDLEEMGVAGRLELHIP